MNFFEHNASLKFIFFIFKSRADWGQSWKNKMIFYFCVNVRINKRMPLMLSQLARKKSSHVICLEVSYKKNCHYRSQGKNFQQGSHQWQSPTGKNVHRISYKNWLPSNSGNEGESSPWTLIFYQWTCFENNLSQLLPFLHQIMFFLC